MKSEVQKYLARIGRNGGLKGTKEQKRQAALARWAKVRAAKSSVSGAAEPGVSGANMEGAKQ